MAGGSARAVIEAVGNQADPAFSSLRLADSATSAGGMESHAADGLLATLTVAKGGRSRAIPLFSLCRVLAAPLIKLTN